MNLFHVAEKLGATQVRIVATDVFPIELTVINGITIAPREVPFDVALNCLSGMFFTCTPLGGIMDDLTPQHRVYLLETYIRPLLIPFKMPTNIITPGDLIIHIRSGDIFQGEEGQGGSSFGGSIYTQPPLSFYLLVVERAFSGLKGRVIIIAENSLNPVILELVKTLDAECHQVTLRLNHDLATDLSWLFCGSNVVFAHGSIGIAVALLSPSIKTAYFFRHNGTGTLEPVTKYIGDQVQKFFVIDEDGSFIPFGGWRNTAAQRRQLLEFPIERLKWDDDFALSLNIALNMPATQSSFSIWSKANDAQGGNNGRITGGFGFHTDVEAEPWWQVDLAREQPIQEIRIFNRVDACHKRARSLRVLISSDGLSWQKIHDQAGQDFGGIDGRPLKVLVAGTAARFVRLQLAEVNCLHLDEVEIY